MLQQLDNAIVVRSERDLVQGSAAARSQSWQEQVQSGNPSMSVYAMIIESKAVTASILPVSALQDS